MFIIKFYRVSDWIKCIGFSVLALTVFNSAPFLFILGLIQTCFLFSFLFSLNDLTDFIVRNEKNYIGILIKKSVLSIKSATFLCFLPLLLSLIPFLLYFSISYFVFYIFFICLSFCYSAPKIRLRDIPIIDLICNILFFFLIFIQSYFFVNVIPHTKVYFFLFWIISYIFSLEIIHQLSHFKKDEKSKRLSMVIMLGKKRSIEILRFSFLMPIVLGFLFFLIFPDLIVYSIIISLSGLARFFLNYKINERINFKKLRNKMGGTIEGIVYLILNLINK